jgi:hypothetical protein
MGSLIGRVLLLSEVAKCRLVVSGEFFVIQQNPTPS